MVVRAAVVAGCTTIGAMSERVEIRTQVYPDDYAASAWEKEITKLAAKTGGEAAARSVGYWAKRAADDRRAAESASPPAGPSWAGVKHRAVEHLVLASGSASAATPSGTYPDAPSWVLDLGATWTTAAMPIVAATSIVEIDGTRGAPAIPVVTDAPTVGPQSGEKKELFSSAFTIGPATTVDTIDRTLYLNWSGQLQATSAAELGYAVASATVASAADAQVGGALVTRGTAAATLDAALALFATGRYLPSTLLVGPGGLGALGAYRAADLAALGVAVTLAKVTKPVLLDGSAVLGWLIPLQATAVEPSSLGTLKAWGLYGKVAVDSAGVATIG